MKTIKCIIRLKFVPENIIRETDGNIDVGMYLRRDAVDCLLRGEMFSGVDCMWNYASILTEKIALQAHRQLLRFGMVGSIIRFL